MIERSFPKLAIHFDPFRRLPERPGVQFDLVDPTMATAAEQSGLFEDAEMFRDRRERHLVGPGQLSDTVRSGSEMGEEAAPGGIGQGRKSPAQIALRIFNHLVNNLADEN